MTYEETGSVLLVIATFFPHSFALSDEAMVGVWHRELSAFDAAEVDRAVRHLCRTQPAFPSLKDVIDRLSPASMGPTEAWGQVTAWADRSVAGPLYVGGEPQLLPELPPMLAQAARVIGDARAIAARTGDDEPAMRAHFFRAFEEAQTKQRHAEQRDAIQAPKAAAQRLADASRAIGRAVPPGGAA